MDPKMSESGLDCVHALGGVRGCQVALPTAQPGKCGEPGRLSVSSFPMPHSPPPDHPRVHPRLPGHASSGLEHASCSSTPASGDPGLGAHVPSRLAVVGSAASALPHEAPAHSPAPPPAPHPPYNAEAALHLVPSRGRGGGAADPGPDTNGARDAGSSAPTRDVGTTSLEPPPPPPPPPLSVVHPPAVDNTARTSRASTVTSTPPLPQAEDAVELLLAHVEREVSAVTPVWQCVLHAKPPSKTCLLLVSSRCGATATTVITPSTCR
jgi:hypothetical protein